MLSAEQPQMITSQTKEPETIDPHHTEPKETVSGPDCSKLIEPQASHEESAVIVEQSEQP